MTPTFDIHYGDTLSVMDQIESESVQCVVTSPPYFGKMNVGAHPAEIGKGSLQDYLDHMTIFFHEVWRILAADGIFWLNVGDSSSKSGGSGGDFDKESRKGLRKSRPGSTGLLDMQQCGVPERLDRIATEVVGFRRRLAIVWDRQSVAPEDVRHTRRPMVSHEMIYMFSKIGRHAHNMEELMAYLPTGEKGSVWHIKPERTKKGDIPAFPEEIPRRCILGSTQPGDLVCDPFLGTGTTGRVAAEMGRSFVGIDLYPSNLGWG